MTDFRRLLDALVAGRVDFVIVGGLASTAHGSARLTQDIDVVYSRAPKNLKRMIASLAPYRPYLRGVPQGLPFRWDAATLERGLNFTLTTAIGDIDLLGEIAGGGGYDALLAHTVELEMFGFHCRCLDLPTLIHVKRAAGRPKDLEVLAELEALLEDQDESGHDT
jgi:DNA-binding transcriptional LysR family regulator